MIFHFNKNTIMSAAVFLISIIGACILTYLVTILIDIIEDINNNKKS